MVEEKGRRRECRRSQSFEMTVTAMNVNDTTLLSVANETLIHKKLGKYKKSQRQPAAKRGDRISDLPSRNETQDNRGDYQWDNRTKGDRGKNNNKDFSRRSCPLAPGESPLRQGSHSEQPPESNRDKQKGGKHLSAGARCGCGRSKPAAMAGERGRPIGSSVHHCSRQRALLAAGVLDCAHIASRDASRREEAASTQPDFCSS